MRDITITFTPEEAAVLLLSLKDSVDKFEKVSDEKFDPIKITLASVCAKVLEPTLTAALDVPEAPKAAILNNLCQIAKFKQDILNEKNKEKK